MFVADDPTTDVVDFRGRISDNFDAEVGKEKGAFVEFYAPWYVFALQ